MNTILVWVLVTVGGYHSNQVTYSPQMADLESCQRIQQSIEKWAGRTQCVQIRIPNSK